MRVKNGLVDQRYWVVSDCGWSGGPYTTQLIAKEIKDALPAGMGTRITSKEPRDLRL